VKLLILSLAFVAAHSTILAGCDRRSTDAQQMQKQKQQEAADKEAMKGEFKKSPGKSY
jgi:heme exporter protein D